MCADKSTYITRLKRCGGSAPPRNTLFNLNTLLTVKHLTQPETPYSQRNTSLTALYLQRNTLLTAEHLLTEEHPTYLGTPYSPPNTLPTLEHITHL